MSLDKVLETIDSSGFFSCKKLLKYGKNARVWLAVGQRRIGKTLTMLHAACELFLQDHRQTMWLRNKKVELEDDGFVNTFLNAAHEFGWCPDGWVCKRDGVWTADKGGEQVILFQSVSTFSNRRGNMTPDVDLIVFDEFMPEDRRYPPKCATGLMSLTKTVLSGREDARCIMLSNFISCANPYFLKFSIYPDKKYDVTYFADKSIAMEICRGYRCAIIKENPWNAFYRSGNYGDYAAEDEDELFKLVSKIPNGAKPGKIAILQDQAAYSYYEKDGFYYWDEFKGDLNRMDKFTSSSILLRPKVMALAFIKDFIDEGIEAAKFRYVNPNVMYAVMSEKFNDI